MKKVTILDLWKKTAKNNTPLLGSTESLSTSPISSFMSEYVSNYPQIDRYIAKTLAHFYPIWNVEMEDGDEDAVLTQFQLDVLALLYKNKQKYSKIWTAMGLTYDPLENYNREETHSNQDTLTITKGAHTDSYVKGQETLTMNEGAGQVTTTEKVNGFNESSFTDANQSVTANLAKVDSNVSSTRTDQTTVGGSTDTEQTAYGHKIVTKGNIGVTTSQQMLQSEVDLWNNVNFYQYLINDINAELCNILTD